LERTIKSYASLQEADKENFRKSANRKELREMDEYPGRDKKRRGGCCTTG
jgi:flagellar biosynthesis chaperone FliJ